jgi:hypothetical protein
LTGRHVNRYTTPPRYPCLRGHSHPSSFRRFVELWRWRNRTSARPGWLAGARCPRPRGQHPAMAGPRGRGPGAPRRISRLRTFTWLMVGIYQSRSVHFSKIASKIPGATVLVSTVRRLSHWLDNPAVRVREWYAPIARGLLQAAADTVKEVRLIADGSKVGFGHQLLIISLAFRRRAIPLAWTWVKSPKGHSSASKQLALLTCVCGLLPADIPVLLPESLPRLYRWGLPAAAA